MSRPVTYDMQSVKRGTWTVHGKVNNDSTPAVLAGDGFSVAYAATGICTITFHTKAPYMLSFHATPVGGTATTGSIAVITTDYSASAGTIVVSTFTQDFAADTGAAADVDFYFTAVFSDATPRPA